MFGKDDKLLSLLDLASFAHPPDHVVEKGGRVYVRTYDADYVFDVT